MTKFKDNNGNEIRITGITKMVVKHNDPLLEADLTPGKPLDFKSLPPCKTELQLTYIDGSTAKHEMATKTYHEIHAELVQDAIKLLQEENDNDE